MNLSSHEIFRFVEYLLNIHIPLYIYINNNINIRLTFLIFQRSKFLILLTTKNRQYGNYKKCWNFKISMKFLEKKRFEIFFFVKYLENDKSSLKKRILNEICIVSLYLLNCVKEIFKKSMIFELFFPTVTITSKSIFFILYWNISEYLLFVNLIYLLNFLFFFD